MKRQEEKGLIFEPAFWAIIAFAVIFYGTLVTVYFNYFFILATFNLTEVHGLHHYVGRVTFSIIAPLVLLAFCSVVYILFPCEKFVRKPDSKLEYN
jgi:hypothetical protein